MKKVKSYKLLETTETVVHEPIVAFLSTPLISTANSVPVQKAYTFKHFKKVMDKVDFTLADWADLLCTSERTLQRYAKANSEFNGLQRERILLLEQMIEKGNALFGANFTSWLKKPSVKYNGDTPFSKLFTHNEVLGVIDYLGQLEHGIFA